jgi:hypothetical protein
LIDLRYHIISIVAVFLALGLGILLGSSFVSGPLAARLESDLARAREARDRAERTSGQATEELAALRERLAEEAGPWALAGRLLDRPVVTVAVGGELPNFSDHVLDAMNSSGARPSGTIVLSDRLNEPASEERLVETVRSVVAEFDPGEDAAVSALTLLGSTILRPEGIRLLDELAGAGFLNVRSRPAGAWPPAEAAFVVMSPSSPDGESRAFDAGAAFARALAQAAPVLAVSDRPDGASVVTDLRTQDDLPADLSTFDSATDEADPAGIGVAAAMLAATEGRGGHFGAGRGLSFVPLPS